MYCADKPIRIIIPSVKETSPSKLPPLYNDNWYQSNIESLISRIMICIIKNVREHFFNRLQTNNYLHMK